MFTGFNLRQGDRSVGDLASSRADGRGRRASKKITMRRIRAISIKQPFAELIMRGKKRLEYRSLPTRVRGRVYVYASLKPHRNAEWQEMMLRPEGVPRGLIIGTVEIVGCQRLRAGKYAWELSAPRRLRKPLAPKAHPQPVWFYPFGR